jgi:glycyl-tRNA synthetase beta chain
MNKSLLVEIGVEELPAIPFLKEFPNIKLKWKNVLKEYGLESECNFFYTPRRFIFSHNSFKKIQDDLVEELYGAPVEIAFKDGKPTPAAFGFAKKCGVDISEVKVSKKGNREVLYYKRITKGKESIELLGEIVEKFLDSLHFGKSMRWGSQTKSFIRPIRWIGVMLGSEIASFEIFGVKSSNLTYPHRTISYEPIKYSSKDEFFEILEKSGIIYKQDKRREKILSEFKDIEQKEEVSIELDEKLLKEVVTITEYPTALLGKFDEEFLKLPPEVIITSMKEHQRYFPVFKDGELTNRFVVVSNALTDDFSKVIEGNQKVLRARLSDAMFFYENDLKNRLNPESLKNITFMNELGSVYDKELRELKIANYLNKKYNISSDKLIKKAIIYSKADLVTDMVYEFTELQGLMGYYYAKEQNFEKEVCLAIKEQYLPDGEDSKLPSSDFSAIIALSNKLDSFLALFSIGKIPTGTKDPFALRRATLGIIKIVLDREFSFDITKDIKALLSEYKEFDTKVLEEFFIERLLGYYPINKSLVKSVLDSGERDLIAIDKKVKALNEIANQSDFKEKFSTFKRVANIIKDMDMDRNLEIKEELFKKEAEKNLYNFYIKASKKEYDSFKEKLEALFGLKPYIDSFFDTVMVNDKDEKIKENRKNLIGSIYKSFKSIADIKEISI